MFRYLIALTLVAGLLSSCGFRRKKYENPITKDTKQPDKVLFDRSINDIEHGRYEVARITLNTLINTYDQSEYMAKAKLAVADSWYREGGAHGMAQAEAEYKDFILFYPTLPEAAESQQKICQIHYRQMEKADRDPSQAYRAEDECRALVVQFPNSKFVPETQQLLRNIQEAIADGEFRVGAFYLKKGSNPAAANRLNHMVDSYPLYSKADQALWDMGEAYGKMGTRFRNKAGDAYARIVRDYPLSGYVDNAKKRLTALELPIPQVDRAAYDRMKWEMDNRQKAGMVSKSTGFLKRGPDVHGAAKSGAPTMTALRPTIPASVPIPAGTGTGVTDVSVGLAGDSNALATQPEARANPPAAQSTEAAPTAGDATQPAAAAAA
ncbi:MAG: outer membrane protein assembly factor BamD, partial [Acidobacteriota bacterium]|nr:outer membrane protein assembly factor BamD [Acidobacteriota bacterium]